MKMMKDRCGIGGYLVGLGVRHVDGTEDFKFLDKPVHNMVVDCGLDILFHNGNRQMPGSADSNTYNLFGVEYTEYADSYFGITRWFGIGTGTTPATAGDTALEAQLGGLALLKDASSQYRYKNSNSGYWGTKKVSNGHIATRLSVYSVAVPSGGVIGEIGFFGGWRQDNTTVSRLFSRIVIPEELRPTLAAGEQLIVTYELNMVSNYAGEDPIDLGNIGIKDGNGDDLGICAEARAYWPGTTNWGNPVNGIGYTTNFGENQIRFSTAPRCLIPCGNTTSSTTGSSYRWISYANHEFEFKPVGETNDYAGLTAITINDNNISRVGLYARYSMGTYTLGEHRVNCAISIINTSNIDYNIGYVRFPWSIDFKFYKMIDGVKTYYDIPLVAGSKLTFNFIKSVGRLEETKVD